MKSTKEIKALFHLLDDPDREIFDTVSEKIVHYGKAIIPNLEELWESTNNNEVQERIENIIHKLNFSETEQSFAKWFTADKPNLLDGAILLSRFRYAEVQEDELRKVIKSLYQSCWLEISNYLTPLEQINVINSIIYSMYKFFGQDLDANKPNHYFINDVAETRMGNSYSIGLIYQYLCELLDIPVFAIQLPRQYLLAYFDTAYNFFDTHKAPSLKIQFYIDPNDGTIFTQNDVDVYLKKYELSTDEFTYQPLEAKDIIVIQMEALITLYEQLGDDDAVKDLNKLLQIRNL